MVDGQEFSTTVSTAELNITTGKVKQNYNKIIVNISVI